MAGAVLALATGGVGADPRERPAAVPATPPARQTETPQMNRGRDPLAPNRRLPALGAQPGGAAPAGAAAGSRGAPATPPANGVSAGRTAGAAAASATRGPTTPAPPAQQRAAAPTAGSTGTVPRTPPPGASASPAAAATSASTSAQVSWRASTKQLWLARCVVLSSIAVR